MKGLILSGGKGTRLRPITYTRAKQLIPVANKPVIHYGIEALVQAGIREIGVIVGDTRVEIQEALGDGQNFGCTLTYIHQEEPLGLAHAVMVAEDFLKGSPFVMYLGDNLIFDSLEAFIREFQENQWDAEILLAPVEHPEQFGVAELKDGKVSRLIEKPKEPPSNLALVGVYLFSDPIFEAAHAIKPSWRGELEITDAIQYLIEKGYHVRPHKITGWWKDTGKAEDLLEANRMVLDHLTHPRMEGNLLGKSRVEGKVMVESGASLEDSVVRGPAIIGAGTILKDTFIAPYTSIGKGCLVENCEIGNSILLDSVEVRGIPRLEASLLGMGVKINHSEEKPKGFRFILGDQSHVEVPG